MALILGLTGFLALSCGPCSIENIYTWRSAHINKPSWHAGPQETTARATLMLNAHHAIVWKVLYLSWNKVRNHHSEMAPCSDYVIG